MCNRDNLHLLGKHTVNKQIWEPAKQESASAQQMFRKTLRRRAYLEHCPVQFRQKSLGRRFAALGIPTICLSSFPPRGRVKLNLGHPRPCRRHPEFGGAPHPTEWLSPFRHQAGRVSAQSRLATPLRNPNRMRHPASQSISPPTPRARPHSTTSPDLEVFPHSAAYVVILTGSRSCRVRIPDHFIYLFFA